MAEKWEVQVIHESGLEVGSNHTSLEEARAEFLKQMLLVEGPGVEVAFNDLEEGYTVAHYREDFERN